MAEAPHIPATSASLQRLAHFQQVNQRLPDRSKVARRRPDAWPWQEATQELPVRHFDAGSDLHELSGVAFILTSGTLQVFASPCTDSTIPIMTLPPGAFIGDVGVIVGQPQQAQFTCLTPVSCAILTKSDFDLATSRYPNLSPILHVISLRFIDSLYPFLPYIRALPTGEVTDEVPLATSADKQVSDHKLTF